MTDAALEIATGLACWTAPSDAALLGGGITNLGLNGNYKLSEKHKIGFQGSNLMKQTENGNSMEITFSANYNYAF